MNSGRIVRNLLSGFLAACGCLVAAGGFLLTSIWVGQGVARPEPAHGLIYLLKGFRAATFVSHFQSAVVPILIFGGIGLFFVALGLTPKVNVHRHVSWGAVRWDWNRDDPENVARWGMIVGALAACILILGVWMAAG